jgi:hypothetical protein
MKLIEFGNLAIHLSETPTETTYVFAGEVNENFRQQEVPRPSTSTVVLVLENISHFNSCGIREWVYMIKDFAKKSRLVFKKCSVAMVDQINMVPDSILGGEVESFYAPYACEEHGESSKLIEMSAMYHTISQRKPPSMTCEHCNSELDFDALPQSYFLFCSHSMTKAS